MTILWSRIEIVRPRKTSNRDELCTVVVCTISPFPREFECYLTAKESKRKSQANRMGRDPFLLLLLKFYDDNNYSTNTKKKKKLSVSFGNGWDGVRHHSYGPMQQKFTPSLGCSLAHAIITYYTHLITLVHGRESRVPSTEWIAFTSR